jgi:hypothetical protein
MSILLTSATTAYRNIVRSRDTYEEYYKSKKDLFSFLKPDLVEKEKQLVVGVAFDKFAKAYSMDHQRKRGTLTDHAGNKSITLVLDSKTDMVSAPARRDVEVVQQIEKCLGELLFRGTVIVVFITDIFMQRDTIL